MFSTTISSSSMADAAGLNLLLDLKANGGVESAVVVGTLPGGKPPAPYRIKPNGIIRKIEITLRFLLREPNAGGGPYVQLRVDYRSRVFVYFVERLGAKIKNEGLFYLMDDFHMDLYEEFRKMLKSVCKSFMLVYAIDEIRGWLETLSPADRCRVVTDPYNPELLFLHNNLYMELLHLLWRKDDKELSSTPE